MKLSKRVAAKLQKENYAEIARELGISRATPGVWIRAGAVPNWHIDKLSEYLGYKIK